MCPNNDTAIAVLDEKTNQYRLQANGYEAQVAELKSTSRVQAIQSAKITGQIKELSSKK